MSKSKSKSVSVYPQKNHLLLIAGVTAAVLMIPLVAMQFSNQWDWKLSDFIVMGALLFAVGCSYDFFARKTKSTQRRMLIGLGLFILLALIWAELAVGIIGSPFAGS